MNKLLHEDYGFCSEEEFLSGLRKHSLGEACNSSGVPFCYKDGSVYTDDADSHTLIFGNTGTKKTRNFCIPSVYTIGMAGESMVISDPKGEIYRNTSGFLTEKGYDIKVFNLREPECGLKWNPLALPYRYYKSGDVDRALEMLSDLAEQLKASVHSEYDLYWENQAMDLFIGLVLMLFESATDESEVHMLSVLHIRSHIELETGKEESVFWNFYRSFPEDSFVRYKLASIYLLRKTEKTFSCVVGVYDSMVRAFMFSHKLMSMLSATELSFDNLGEKKTALYLITPDEKTTFHFLVSVFVKQCYERIIERAQMYSEGKLPLRVNFILDEFSNFPRISDMPAMISAARSRNIRFVLVVQSKQQLNSMYGDDAETIKSNCKNWIYLSCRELGLLREIEELCGTVFINNREVPLLNITKLQHLKIGWEDSQALVLRAAVEPYITWVKDFSVYPQAKYQNISFERRAFEQPPCFSVQEYMYQKLKKELEEEEDILMDADDWDVDNE
ncbi:MAG: type IV secretory system conjugative DNA transfer family protein [Lachnospiraceae bacterium]|nr:type IV secretory system conjugative DNA transfer family protein [Lachnospiraceae bacterium]